MMQNYSNSAILKNFRDIRLLFVTKGYMRDEWQVFWGEAMLFMSVNSTCLSGFLRNSAKRESRCRYISTPALSPANYLLHE